MNDKSDASQPAKPTSLEDEETHSTSTKSSGYSSNAGASGSDKDAGDKPKKEIDSSSGFSPPDFIPMIHQPVQSTPSSSGGNSSGTPGTGSSSGTTTTASPGAIGSSSHTSTPTSGGTNSSVDTVPTSSPEEKQPLPDNCWGILTPMQTGFLPSKLVKDEKYIFGRSRNAHYTFNVPSISKTKYYTTFSKAHFAISRVLTEDGKTDQVFIQDLGGHNGTFINGDKVEKNSKVILPNHSRIAIANPSNDILLFEGSNTVNEYPQEISRRFVISKQLGQGACSKVMEAWDKNTLEKHAIKMINKEKSLVPSRNDWLMEAKILQKLKHPCIIDIHDVIDVEKSLFIVLEYAPGEDLFARVQRGRIKESTAKLLFFQMVKAVQYLHANGITHRDLKPENILLMSKDDECLLKITDFGMSCFVNENSFMKTLAGTPTYVAPEMIPFFDENTGPSGYTKQVDMWSLGVILFVCLVSYPPFANSEPDKNDIFKKIVTGSYAFDKKRWSSVSDKAKNLVRLLLKLDPKQRLTAGEAIRDIWFNDAPVMKKVNELMNHKIPNETAGSSSKVSKSGNLKRNVLQSQAFSLSQRSVDKENEEGPTRPKYAKP